MAKSLIKERKVFALDNFRGLDTTNKPLNVARNRASDGYNFKIDGGSLKTRPSFNIDEEVKINLYNDEYIIDWYKYNNQTIYITTKDIIVFIGTTYTRFLNASYNFANKKPIFAEEKDCLFIFGLEKIFVYAYIDNVIYFYDLANKPITTPYENLPTSYVPTLFTIGDTTTKIDDINLLSKKSKYKLFANTKDKTYFLPTTYDGTKNGNYSKEIFVYGNSQNGTGKSLAYYGFYDNESYFNNLKVSSINEFNGVSPIVVSSNTIDFGSQKIFKETYKAPKITNINWKIPQQIVSFNVENENSFPVYLYVQGKYTNIIIQQGGVVSYGLDSMEGGSFVIHFKIVGASPKVQISSSSQTTVYDDNTSTQGANKTFDVLYDLDKVELDLNLVYSTIVNNETLMNTMNTSLNTHFVVKYPIKYTLTRTTPDFSEVIGTIESSPNDYINILFEKINFDNILSISFSQTSNCFIATKNETKFQYICDYLNEPAIAIEFTFQYNPDSLLITQCTFGTIFGSENRLFLSGHLDHPNIDRYNVSNNLLGDNVISQSYELTYFPSKNYNVVGGNGAINGYVIASDSTMYITKKEYSNDDMLFVRTRNISTIEENSLERTIITYFDTRTSIKETPINNRCIVRFNNDILMLSKNGLFGVDISSNVLANERLLKHRDYLVYKSIVEDIKEELKETKPNIYITCNSYYLYLFIGKKCYFIDNMYIYKDDYDNVNYEICKWELAKNFVNCHIENNELKLVDELGVVLYKETNNGIDDDYSKTSLVCNNQETYSEFTLIDSFIPSSFDKIKNTRIVFGFGSSAYRYLYLNSFTIINSTNGFLIRIPYDFYIYGLNREDIVYIKDENASYHKCKIVSLDDSDNINFDIYIETLEENYTIDISKEYYLLENVNYKELYLYSKKVLGDDITYILSSFYPLYYSNSTSILSFDIDDSNLKYCKYDIIDEDTSEDYCRCMFNYKNDIEFLLVSSILDFGNNLYEKTIFNFYMYATKLTQSNNIYFGYKTMNKIKKLDDGQKIQIAKKIDVSNIFDLNYFDFNMLSLNTFNELGCSIIVKENNFLYIQILVKGIGNIELNSINILFKLNRMLRGVG